MQQKTKSRLVWSFAGLGLAGAVVDLAFELQRFGVGVLWAVLSGFVLGGWGTMLCFRRAWIILQEATSETIDHALGCVREVSAQNARLVEIQTEQAKNHQRLIDMLSFGGKQLGVAGLDHFMHFAACAHLEKRAPLTDRELETLTHAFVQKLVRAGIVVAADSKAVN